MRAAGISGEELIELEDYAEFDGLWLPCRIKHSFDGLPLETVKVKSVRQVASSASYSFYQPLVARTNATSFDTTASAQLETYRAASGHLLMRPRINGVELGWFILDTGAISSVISQEAAARLRLPQLGALPLVSVFGSSVSAVRRAETFTLGPMMMRQPILVEMDFTPLSQAFGLPVAGIIGYDLFSRAVVEVDAARQAAAVYEPQTYHLSQGAW